MLYRFDKKLRMLLLNEIEKIEIAVREAIMNITAEMSGDDFWLMNSVHFANARTFADTTISLIESTVRQQKISYSILRTSTQILTHQHGFLANF